MTGIQNATATTTHSEAKAKFLNQTDSLLLAHVFFKSTFKLDPGKDPGPSHCTVLEPSSSLACCRLFIITSDSVLSDLFANKDVENVSAVVYPPLR